MIFLLVELLTTLLTKEQASRKVCGPGRNEEAFASESFLSFGTPDHQEAPHYPTHNFDVDLWIDL